jgi:hypothetical protein
VTDECRVEQVKSDLDHTSSFHAQQLLRKSQSLQQVFNLLYPHQQLGETKSLCKVDSKLNDDHRTMCVIVANTHLQLWKKEGSAFVDNILTVYRSWMHSFDPDLKRQIAEWPAKKSLRKKIVRGSRGALRVMHIMFFNQNDLVFDHPVLISTMVRGQYCCALLQDKISQCLHHKQPELLEHGVILLQENTTHCHSDMQNLGQSWGWEVLRILPTLQSFSSDYWLFANVKEHLRGKRFELEYNISTAVTVSLHHLSKDEHSCN